jgi:hypothetical protein
MNIYFKSVSYVEVPPPVSEEDVPPPEELPRIEVTE